MSAPLALPAGRLGRAALALRRHAGALTALRTAVLIGLAAGIVVWGIFGSPLEQSQEYHHFADVRSWLGIPNAADTLSNFAFLVVGLAGLAFLRREWRSGASTRIGTRGEIALYGVFFAAVVMTAFGSAYYHWAPDDARLLWDRLPMAVAFMSLLAAVAAERTDARAACLLAAPLVVLGIGSVAWWRVSELAGVENLRPYLAVQYGAMALVFALALLYRSRYSHGAQLFVVLAVYAAAKLLESCDDEIYALGGWVSGHTLKHLAAAVAAYWVLASLERRRPARSASGRRFGRMQSLHTDRVKNA